MSGQRQDFGNNVPHGRKSSPNTEYPTPNVEDVIVIEDIAKPVDYRPILPGTPRANDPDLLLLGEREFLTNESKAWIRRAWATRRHGEDSFNAALSYADKVNPAYPIYVRTYHILRAEYAPLTPGVPLKSVVSIKVTEGGAGYSPDGLLDLTITGTGTGATAVCEVRNGIIISAAITNGGDGYTADPTVTVTTPGGGGDSASFVAKVQPQTALLTEQEAVPAEGIRLPHLDGQNAQVAQAALFLKVTRVWRTLPGPVIGATKLDFDGMVLTTTRQEKLAASIASREMLSSSVTGPGTGATAIASLVFDPATGTATVTPHGSGATAHASFTEDTGSGATGSGTLSAGSVNSLSVTFGGSGYTVPPIVTIIRLDGPGGMDATATCTINGSGVVDSITITNPGDGYDTSIGVEFSPGIVPGPITGLTVDAGGSGYTVGALISIAGDGTGAFATPIFTGGVLTGLTLTDGGDGYTNATVTITPYGTVTAGGVSHAGSGYTSAPAVTVTGDGTGATATAALSGTGVLSITITAPGTGYTTAGFSIAAPTTGILDSIAVITGGALYATAPTVTMSGGGGSGGAATSTLTADAVTSIAVTGAGSGYTSAPTVTITPVDTQEWIRTTKEDGERSTLVATEIVETRVIPGNVIPSSSYDPVTESIVTETKQIIASSTAAPSITSLFTDYRDVANGSVTKFRIIRTYPSSVTDNEIVEYKPERYPYPALLTWASGTLDGLTKINGEKVFIVKPYVEAERPMIVAHRHTTSFTTSAPNAAAINSGILGIRPTRVIYGGILFSINSGAALTNETTVTATTGSDDPVWGAGLVESYLIPDSVPNVTDYLAARAANEWFGLVRQSRKIAKGLYMLTLIEVPYK